MERNLFVYESHYGTTKKVVDIFALLAANSKVCDVKEFNANFELYDNIFFAVGFHGQDTAKLISELIIKHKDILFDKKIGYIGVGLSEHGSENYIKIIENALGRNVDYDMFVHGEVRVDKLTLEDKETLKVFLEKQNLKLIDMGVFKEEEVCDKASLIIDKIKRNGKTMPDEMLKKEIDDFINSKNTCVLSTGDDDFVRGTPIEFLYHKDNFYFITEGGLKYRGILKNRNVSICLFNEYSGFNKLKGLQIEGKAEFVEIGSPEYKEIMKLKNIKEEFLKNVPINMNVLKVKIKRYEFLNSEFREKGFDSKQIYVL